MHDLIIDDDFIGSFGDVGRQHGRDGGNGYGVVAEAGLFDVSIPVRLHDVLADVHFLREHVPPPATGTRPLRRYLLH